MVPMVFLKTENVNNGWSVSRLPEVLLDTQPPCAWNPTMSIFLVLLAVGRKQFMRFECANHAAEALGCEFEELNTATFKHHLRQIIEQVTRRPRRPGLEDEETSSGSILGFLGEPVPLGQALGTHQAFSCFRGGFTEDLCPRARQKGDDGPTASSAQWL
jgi:hypothetical protein